MIMPSNEYTFNIVVVGEKTKKKYEGSFTVKCLLSVQEMVEVGLRMDRYNQGSSTVSPGVTRMNRAIAEMEIRQIKTPSWWKDSDDGRTFLDANVVFEVFLKALDAETEFDKRIAEQAKEADEQTEKAQKKAKG